MSAPKVIVEFGGAGIEEVFVESTSVVQEVSGKVLFRHIKPGLEGINLFLKRLDEAQQLMRQEV